MLYLHASKTRLAEKSEALSTGIDQMSVDEVTPIEPTLSDAGELPSTWASDVDLRHEEVLGPADPISLGGPAGVARRASSSRDALGAILDYHRQLHN